MLDCIICSCKQWKLHFWLHSMQFNLWVYHMSPWSVCYASHCVVYQRFEQHEVKFHALLHQFFQNIVNYLIVFRLVIWFQSNSMQVNLLKNVAFGKEYCAACKVSSHCFDAHEMTHVAIWWQIWQNLLRIFTGNRSRRSLPLPCIESNYANQSSFCMSDSETHGFPSNTGEFQAHFHLY